MAEFAASFRASLTEDSDPVITSFSEGNEGFDAGFDDVIGVETRGAVRYDVEQELTETQKETARDNIDAADAADLTAHINDSSVHVTSAEKSTWNSKYTKPADGIPPTDLRWDVQQSLDEADEAWHTVGTHVQDTTVHFESGEKDELYQDIDDMQDDIEDNASAISTHASNTDIHVTAAEKDEWDAKYTRPAGGIPAADMTQSIEQTLDEAAHDHVILSQHIQNSTIHVTANDKTSWNSKYTKPATGIPASDLAAGVVPTKTSDLTNDGADGISTYVEADDLAAVATSGSYNDLSDKPTIPAPITDYVHTGTYSTAQYRKGGLVIGAANSSEAGGVNVTNGRIYVTGVSNPLFGLKSSDANSTQFFLQVTKDHLYAGPTSTNALDFQADGKTTMPSDLTVKGKIIKNGGTSAQFLKADGSVDSTAYSTFSGDYNDLSNKPTIPAAQVNSDWDATSGVAEILNKPSIPTKTSDLTNDSDFITESAVDTKISTKADSAGASANYAAKLTASIPYGECDSTSTATAFTARVPGITELRDGVCMLLYNGVITSASGFTINVNGLGAKPSYSNMAMGNPVTPTSPTRDTTIFNINYAFLFVYSETLVSGGCWIGYRGYDANTNTIGYQIRTNSYSLPMKSITYRYRLLFTSADGAHFVPANNSTSTNATASRTVCQDPIDPFGTIVYYGTTASVAAGSRPSASYLWQEYTLTLGYSFNRTGAALTLTSWKPVYVKCAPQTDGSAIIDSTTPYVQDLPTTNDGKIYIFLGVAYSATSIELNLAHPVYYHDGNGIKLWTGSSGGGTYTETDPTVPAWAKAPTKPTYTASEVGAQVAPLVGQINDNTASDYLTPAQVFAAVAAGRQVFASTSYLSAPLVFSAFNSGVDANSGNAIVIANLCYSLIMLALLGDVTSGVWNISAQVLVNDTIYGQIPSATSQLTNDSGFITLADLPIWNGGVS